VDLNSLTPEWTGESIAALITVPTLIALLIFGGVAFRRREKRAADKFDRTELRIAWIGCFALALIAQAGLWWGMYPWKAEYHQWRPVSGVVESADSRLMPAGDGSMEQKFVVSFKDNPQQYGVLDTRAAAVRPGDRLTITCVRRWQWSGAHGYDCNFVALERAR
jgi:hypothetical protein